MHIFFCEGGDTESPTVDRVHRLDVPAFRQERGADGGNAHKGRTATGTFCRCNSRNEASGVSSGICFSLLGSDF
jgi:hypothetical protein